MNWIVYSVLVGNATLLILCAYKLISLEHKVDNLLDHICFSRKSIEESIDKRTLEIIEYQSYTKDCFKALASYCSWVESKRKKHKKK